MENKKSGISVAVENTYLKIFVYLVIGATAFYGLYLTKLYNYNLFHNIIELFSIVIAAGIFMIAWNSRKIIQNNYLLFLGIAYLFVAGFDALHTLAYKDMGVFIGYGSNLATQLWISARFLESISLLTALYFIGKKLRVNYQIATYTIISAVLLLSIFYWKIFPVCFIENQGLTLFKIRSEEVIIAILGLSILLLYFKRKNFDTNVIKLIIASLLVTIASEFFFTLYNRDVFGFYNMIGHYLKIISFYLIYKAIIATGFSKPYSLLFRDLKLRESELKQSRLFIEKVADTAPYLVSLFDLEHNSFVYANRQFTDFFGVSLISISSFGNEFYKEVVHPDDYDRVLKVQKKLEKAKSNDIVEMEYRVKNAAGEWRWLKGQMVVFNQNNQGINEQILHSAFDATEQIAAEEAIKIEHDKAQNYLDIAGSIIVVLDNHRNVALINKKGCQVLGYQMEEIIGQNWFENFIPEKERVKTIDAFNKIITGEIKPFEYFENSIITKDGREKTIAWNNTYIKDQSGKITATLSSGEDITWRIEVEKEIIDALNEAEKRKQETEALLKGSKAILEYWGFEEAAQKIFSACKEIIGATAGYIAMVSADNKENIVVFLDTGGRECNIPADTPMPIRGMRLEAMKSGATIYNNYFNESEFVMYLPDGHTNLDNVLFAPLVIHDEVVGLLGLANKKGGFNQNDVRLSSAFAELAAIALRNSRSIESLEESEERFRAVAQSAGDAIVSIDSEGKIIFWNAAAQKIFGYSMEEIHDKKLGKIIPEKFVKAHINGLTRYMETGKSRIIGHSIEMEGKRKNGRIFPLELSLSTWKIRGEIFYTGIIRDITERKHAEIELKNERDKARAYFDIAGAIMVVIESDQKLSLVNRRGQDIIGYRDDEIIGKNWFDSIIIEKEREEARKYFLQMLKGDISTKNRYSNIVRAKNGEEKIIAWHSVRLKNKKNEVIGLLSSGEDVTLQKKAEQAIHEAYDNLEKRVEARTKELSTANIKLKEEIKERKRIEKMLLVNQRKLRSMASQLSLAEEKERRRIASELHDSIGQTLALLKIKLNESKQIAVTSPVIESLTEIINIMDQTIIETRSLAFDLSSPVLYTLGLEAALEKLAEQFQEENNIKCSFNDDKKPKPIDDDVSILLFQAVKELMVNVIKHSKASKLNLSIQNDNGQVLIVVEDNGVGFSEKQINSTWDKNGGFGLFSIKERLDSLNGLFEINSETGAGTKVFLKAPLK